MMQLQDPQYKSPDGAALRIWRDAAPNRYLTEQLGRQIFDDVIYVEVIAPGSGNSTPVFELERVFDEHMNHPEPLRGTKYEELKQYIEDFKKNEEARDSSLAGTPLEQWPEMNRSLVATLKAQGVFTVDALAALPDSKLSVVGPDGRSWRSKAEAYIEDAKGGAHATMLAGKVGQLEIDIAAGQDREKALADRIQELETAAKTGTTAPPSKTVKVKTAADAVAEAAADQTAPVGSAPKAVAAPGETLLAAEQKTETVAATIIPII